MPFFVDMDGKHLPALKGVSKLILSETVSCLGEPRFIRTSLKQEFKV